MCYFTGSEMQHVSPPAVDLTIGGDEDIMPLPHAGQLVALFDSDGKPIVADPGDVTVPPGPLTTRQIGELENTGRVQVAVISHSLSKWLRWLRKLTKQLCTTNSAGSLQMKN